MKKDKKPEVLAPAGSTESIYAAVRCGADGIYVGGKQFSARANAVNFSAEELKAAADYCHLHGVKLYRAMNVIIFDSEAEEFYNEVRLSAEIGIDGLIIQDMGAAFIAARAAADMPRHGSTQMTIHTPMGAVFADKIGLCRIVPARELSLDAIRSICETGIETEAFVHGAQCMCVSGQCYMSALIGSRSANRGRCAQACRLPFSASKKKDSYALSLKDMSVISAADELAAAGVMSFKIEGRMKRPEYVAAAVTALRHALDGEDISYDTKRLEAVFSRSGFTDGYLRAHPGADMFGYRRKEDVTAADSVLPELALLYKDERKSAVIDFDFTALPNESSRLDFSVGNICGSVEGMVPEAARNKSLDESGISAQLSKLGGTRYNLGEIRINIGENLMLPASELNRMRREAVKAADEMTIAANTPVYKINKEPLEKISSGKRFDGEPKLRIRSLSLKNIDRAARLAQLIILPVELCEKLDERYISKTAVSLPAFVTDENALIQRLKTLHKRGFTHFMCENLTHMGTLSALDGIHIHGGTGLNISNSYALRQLAQLGLEDAMLSFEMTAAQISAVKSDIPTGIYACGRLPLMTVRNCPVKAQTGCKSCSGCLTDRTGRTFPVKCSPFGYSTIYNCDILETSDKLSDFKGISFAVLDIDDMDENEAYALVKRYINRQKPSGSFTRGLYYRGVI